MSLTPVILKSLSEHLSGEGFRRKGSALFRETLGNYQLLEVQRSRDVDKFCVNYGVVSRVVMDILGRPAKFPGRSAEWVFCYRLGRDVEKWWKLGTREYNTETAASSMAKTFVVEALPRLKNITHDEDLKSFYLAHFDRRGLHKTLPGLETLMALLRALGPRERFEEVKETYLDVGSGWDQAEATVQRIEAYQR